MALFSIIAASGPLRKIPGIMSVYRKHAQGITSMPAVNDRYHHQRIELMNHLNAFHGYRFDSRARQVIAAHEQQIALEEQRRR
jgi:hypothetical protein